MLDRAHITVRNALTARFRNAWKTAVASIIEAGAILLEGKRQLPHGQFLEWVEHDLGLHQRKAEMLMLVAKHPVLSNPKHVSDLPPSWGTLYQLSFLCRPGQSPKQMLKLIESGQINPFMTRADAQALLGGRDQDSEAIVVSAELASLQRQLTRLSLEQAVDNLRADPGSLDPASVRKFGRWLVKLGQRWQDMAD